MRIHLDGLTIQCLSGSLAEQANIDGLIVFVDTWLQPYGTEAERIHEAGGQRLRGACAEAGPMTLGKLAVTAGFGVPADRLINCVVASLDSPHPGDELIRRCTLEGFRKADGLGLRSVALSPLGSLSNDEASGCPAILQAVAEMPGQAHHLDLVRIIVPDDQSRDDVSMMIVREASRRRQEEGVA
ncbi:macro domain-containing protein [Aminobacter sp. BE322]|uniref:macro domain-containing protein n=1 Tax=unclassified Aminobacter TaxID=2644704 RepID=UPI003D1EB1D1